MRAIYESKYRNIKPYPCFCYVYNYEAEPRLSLTPSQNYLVNQGFK